MRPAAPVGVFLRNPIMADDIRDPLDPLTPPPAAEAADPPEPPTPDDDADDEDDDADLESSVKEPTSEPPKRKRGRPKKGAALIGLSFDQMKELITIAQTAKSSSPELEAAIA